MRFCRYFWFFCLMTFKFFRRFFLVYGLLVFSHSAYSQVDPIEVTEYAVRYSEGTSSNRVKTPWRSNPWSVQEAAQAYCAINNAAHAGNAWNGVYQAANATDIRCFTGSFGNYFFINLLSRTATKCPDGMRLDSAGKCVSDCPMFGTPEGDSAPREQPEGCTCPAGTVWVSMSGCRKKCGSWNSGEKVAGLGTVYGPGQKTGCSQGCEIQPSVEGFEYPDGSFLGISDTYTGWACQGTGPGSGGNGPVKDNPTPKESPKEPPCPTGYGVLTSTSGSVGCVPPAEPDKKIPDGRKPVVENTVKKETYPDGSEKTTKTTKTKDPGTGATHTSSTTASTGGMAGPAGTTTGTETKTGGGKGTGTGSGGDGEGDCEGGDCSGEGFDGPGGDLYEKKDRTMRDALEGFSAAVSDAPAMVAARNWFSIGGMPAGCGGLSVTVPYLNTTISADSIFCGEYGALIMQIAGAVVLAAAAYAGFRIAIL